MMRTSLVRLLTGACMALTLAVDAAEAQDHIDGDGPRSKQVWFGPRAGDFVPIFEGSAPEAPWDAIAGRVGVLSLNEGTVRKMSDAALARLVQDLDRRHITLGLGILPINWFHETPCGHGIEGYSDPNSARVTLAKLQKAGAKVRVISMDEPLWFGHYYSGPNACRSSLEDLAQRTAVLLKIYTAAYPDAVVGDTEPFPALSAQPGWAQGYANWLATFQKATGARIAFLHLDFNWGDPRLNTGDRHDGSNAAAVALLAREASTMARRNGLEVGMIYWGGGGGGDAQWMDNARLHIREIEASDVNPDHAVFTTWNVVPAHTFPAGDPNALASLIPYYLKTRR